MRVLALFFVLCGICTANAASHSLQYGYSITDSLEFTIVGLVDNEEFSYYDSKSRRMIPKTEWIMESVGADYWDEQTQKALNAHQIFKANIRIAMQHFTSTQDVHILEWIVDCQWDDETGNTGGTEHYGYDGKNFFPDAIKNWSFIPPAQQLFTSAVKWNPAEHENDNQTQICIEALKSYRRTVAPKVSVLQEDSSSPVTCHVTGFYPRGIMVTWQRNGEDLDEDVELGETVSNKDGTFQITSHLTVKPEDWKSQKYTCTVHHKSLEQDIVLSVKENIKRNSDIKSSSPVGINIGCVVGAQILAIAVIGVFIWKKRSSGYKTTNTPDADMSRYISSSFESVDSGKPMVRQ